MVNLQALEAAVRKVESIRDHEFSFEVEDTKICLRPLRAIEETEVQKYAQVALEGSDEEGDQGAFADYMDRLRHASLGFSIVQLGSTNLRDLEYIETGEMDEHGNQISVTKWEAVATLMAEEWSRLMLAQVFAKFGEMLDRLELRAQKSVTFEPVDLQEEIERTERRLKELRDTQSKIKQPPPVRAQKKADHEQRDVMAQRGTPDQPKQEQVPRDVQAAVDSVAEEALPEEPQAPAPQASQETPQETPQQPQGRRSAVPTSASAPERPAPQQAAQQPQAQQPQAQQPQAQQPQQPPEPELDKQGIPEPHGGDSFFDPSDPEQAMAAEAQRQAVLRQRHLTKQRAEAEQRRLREEAGIPSDETMTAERIQGDRASKAPRGVSLDQSPGGLRSAANLSNSMLDSNAGSVRSGRPNQPQAPGAGTPAKLHGKDVYKMPTQNLERPQRQRQHGEPAESPVRVNNPSVGGRQTKFRGPQQ